MPLLDYSSFHIFFIGIIYLNPFSISRIYSILINIFLSEVYRFMPEIERMRRYILIYDGEKYIDKM